MYEDGLTPVNYQLYTMTTAGASPVSLADMKAYLGITNTGSDDLLNSLIDACTQWGQQYTGREFTVNIYQLLIDCFESRIQLTRNPIDTIDSVKYTVATVLTTVDPAIYYLKKGVQSSEILLMSGQEWPSDGDEIEQGIEIIFTTEAVGPDKLPLAITAIKRHIAFMFENRGDCSDCGGCAGKDQANVEVLYNYLRIARI